MAQRKRSSRRWRVWRQGEGAGDAGECEGDSFRGSVSVFIERGGEESHDRAAVAINVHGGGVGFTAFKRGWLD
jgi:hypothetical protein